MTEENICETINISEKLFNELSNKFNTLITPDKFNQDFEIVLNALKETIKLLFENLELLHHGNDCEAEINYKLLLAQLEEDFQVFIELTQLLKINSDDLLSLIDKITKTDNQSIGTLKEKIRHYTEHGKFKQMLKDKTYMYKYNTHYSYVLTFSIISMIGFSVYSAYN